MNGAKRNSVTMGGSVHPLDNVLNDDLMNAGAKGGIVGRGKMMGDKAGVFEDSKLVNFGAAREKAMARMGDKLTPRSVFSSAVAGDEDEVYKLLCMEKVKIGECESGLWCCWGSGGVVGVGGGGMGSGHKLILPQHTRR